MTRGSRLGRHRRRLLVAATVLAAMTIVPLVPALADTVTPPPVDIPPAETDFSETVAVEQFDPTLGNLQSITLTLAANVTGSMGIENTSVVSGASGDMELSAAVGVAAASDTATTLAAASPASTEVFSLAVFDGTIDFGGASGITFPDVAAADTVTATLTDPALLAEATGTGSFDLVVTAVGTSGANATGGNIATFFSSQAGATIALTYDYEPIPPEVVVEKATNGADADDPSGGDVPRIAPGDPVAWTYTVTNPSGVPVADVVVTDDQVGVVAGPVSGDADGDGLLDPGEAWVYEASGVAEDLAGTAATTVDGCPDSGGVLYPTYRNMVTVSAVAGGTTITAEDLSHYCHPRTGIVVEKATNGADADDPLGADVPRVAPGEPVTWTYVLSNVGDLAVSDVVVVDDQLGVVAGPMSGDGDGDGVLDVGEVWAYEASGVAEDLTDTPATTVDGCPDPDGVLQPAYRNTATVTGLAAGATVSAQDVSHYCNGGIVPPARIEVVLTDDVGQESLLAGRAFDYAVFVANLGGVASVPAPMELGWDGPDAEYVVLAAGPVSRTDDCIVDGALLTVRELAPGEYVVCLVDVIVAQASNRTVVAKVSAGGVVLDEEPVRIVTLLGETAGSVGPDLVAPGDILPAQVLSVTLGASIDSPVGVLAATGTNARPTVMLGLSGLLMGLALVLLARLRAGPRP